MKVDYIIVGLGLAGIAFCETLLENKKTFVVFDDENNTSSVVAAGLYNPVILKRFTPTWNALEQIQNALPFYKKIEDKLEVQIDYKTPVYRIFTSIDEQNRWFEASDKPILQHFISSKIIPNQNIHLNAPFGFGEVLQSGRIDTKTLLESYRNYLLKNKLLIEVPFEYKNIQTNGDVSYNNIQSKHIVFAEGFGIQNNPFFKQLPLVGNKGEVLTVKIPKLELNFIIKSGVFVIPLGNDLFKVGATYNWQDKDNKPTLEAKEELLGKLHKIINCGYKVITHEAGVRPTVIDRKPLVGSHSEFKNMYVLNGLGTHGVMIAPTVAKNLFDFIENQLPLPKEIDCSRFY